MEGIVSRTLLAAKFKLKVERLRAGQRGTSLNRLSGVPERATEDIACHPCSTPSDGSWPRVHHWFPSASGALPSRILWGLLVTRLVPPGAALVLGADDTVERRRGRQSTAHGGARAAGRSTQQHGMRGVGLTWVVMRLVVPGPWARAVPTRGRATASAACRGGRPGPPRGDGSRRLLRGPAPTAVGLLAHGPGAHAGGVPGREVCGHRVRARGDAAAGGVVLSRPAGDPRAKPGVGGQALVGRGHRGGGSRPARARTPAPRVGPGQGAHHPGPVGPGTPASLAGAVWGALSSRGSVQTMASGGSRALDPWSPTCRFMGQSRVKRTSSFPSTNFQTSVKGRSASLIGNARASRKTLPSSEIASLPKRRVTCSSEIGGRFAVNVVVSPVGVTFTTRGFEFCSL